jgi:hypothetical protein
MGCEPKPWPGDAVMIIAANAGEEDPAIMERVVPAACRDCGAALAADGRTLRRAEALPSRRGRPVLYFCVPCAVGYDVNSITELYDDRRSRA